MDPIPSQFFAVTTTSIYQAFIGLNESKGGSVPRLVKMAILDGQVSVKAPVGIVINNGTMLAICRRMVLFVPEGGGNSFQRELIMVNTGYWGGQTSEIVALFLEEAQALTCSRDGNLTPCDPRWHGETIRTLRAIGVSHPFCSISQEFISQSSPDTYDPLLPHKRWSV